MAAVENNSSFRALNRLSWGSSSSKTASVKAQDVEKKAEPYNDWFNDPGFDWQEEVRQPVELRVTGTIPDYVRGVLYRTGPGGDKVQAENGKVFKIDHWFDGFTLNHRFEIAGENKVIYRSRRACDELLEYVRKTGKKDTYSFGQKRDPCESFFRKVTSSFQSSPISVMQSEGGTKHPSSYNVGVTLSPNMPGAQKLPGVSNSSANGHGGVATLTAKTDASNLQSLDPETLEPIGVARQSTLHPELNGQMSAAHARTCPETGEFFNFNLKFDGPPVYKIFKINPEGEVSIIARLTNVSPAYIHSFFLTRKYVVLCVYSSKLSWGGAKVVYTRNIVDAIAPFDPKNKAKFYVIDRSGEKGLVATFEADACFAFHSVNAYDEGNDIVLDVPIYANLDILHVLYYNILRSTSPDGPVKMSIFSTKYTRFRLADIPESPNATVKPAAVDFADDINMELPVINPKYISKPHRYCYAVCVRGKATWVDGIVKHDTKTHTDSFWEAHGHSPSEPIFVADPNGTEEDDGVLLTVVLDGHHEKSYLLVLNAKDLTEVARADMDTVVSFGFHGTYVGNTQKLAVSI
ncbi:hypothetical protein ABW19_dt0204624 [Dactylella cylindrospora]|nr:hypothetical protein ABW19_dt0204624 [Dactylella cylindrospora]